MVWSLTLSFLVLFQVIKMILSMHGRINNPLQASLGLWSLLCVQVEKVSLLQERYERNREI